MDKFAWKGRITDGKYEEYVRRHNEIWQELKQVLTDAGIVNYTIWTDGVNLFGYYECARGIEYAQQFQQNSPVVKRWNEYMSDVLIFEKTDDSTEQPKMQCIFELN